MAKVSERVVQMKGNFMELHSQGYSIPEIAILHNLGWSTVYQHLQEIADENGVTREDLLMRVQTRSDEAKRREEERRVKVDMEEIKKDFQKAKEAMQRIIDKAEQILEEEKYDN